jgi:TRAP-type C4-dicarboxylate transport system permease small subunit
MSKLELIDTLIEKALIVVIILITIVVVTSMTLQVCGRYFLPLPFHGLDEFTGHTAVWFYMLGAAYSALKSDHIKADMLDIFRIPVKAQYYISLLASLVSIIISGFMIVWSYNYVQWSISRHEVTPSLHIPTVYFQVAILVGAILLFVFFLKELVNRILHKQPLVDHEDEPIVSN